MRLPLIIRRMINRGRAVALVGFANSTFPDAKYSKADEFWTMNQGAMPHNPLNLPGVDRLFEMHSYEEHLLSQNVRDNEKYRDWLGEEHPFPIYVLEERKEIPSGVHYPIEEILKDIFRHCWRGAERNKFLTSTAEQMVALAIHEGFGQIEIYGIEMASGSEYRYQREGMSHMLGVAEGRGIDVVLHKRSALLRAKLYGYEAGQMLPHSQMQPLLEAFSKYEAKARVNAVAKDGIAQVNALAWQNLYGGARQACEKLMSLGKLTTRQTAETYYRAYAMQKATWLGEANVLFGTYEGKLDKKSYQKAVEALNLMYSYDGAMQACEQVIALCDLQEARLELEMTVVPVDLEHELIEPVNGKLDEVTVRRMEKDAAV